MANVEIVIALLFVISFLALASYRYRFPFPIALILCGLAISLIPGLKPVTLSPDVIFFIFLPPLLYYAAWNTTWHDFKANLRPIALASIGLVFFTTLAIGALIHWLIPGFSWAESFLLGAIISPPDAIAATSITSRLGLHPRIITILEGESLVNDASALIAYKYAKGAIIAGSFAIGEASFDFFKVFLGGIAIGFLVGYLMYLLHKHWVGDSIVDVTLTVLTPFASYILAEHLKVSGVLAVVVTGLYVSFRVTEIFSHKARIEVYAVWNTITFILNGLVFILMGLQLKLITQDFTNQQILRYILYGIVTAVIALLVRFVWSVPAAYLPAILSKRIRNKEKVDKRNIVIFTWAGMRGIVSMAAALAIPITAGNQQFPHRSEIVFISFCVIVFTLVVQGGSLPWLIKKLGIKKHSILVDEYNVRSQIINDTKSHIDKKLGHLSEELRSMLHSKYDVRLGLIQQTKLPVNKKPNMNPATAMFNQFAEIQLDLLQLERDMANSLRKEGKASEEILRKIEHEIDLEEGRLRMELYER